MWAESWMEWDTLCVDYSFPQELTVSFSKMYKSFWNHQRPFSYYKTGDKYSNYFGSSWFFQVSLFMCTYTFVFLQYRVPCYYVLLTDGQLGGEGVVVMKQMWSVTWQTTQQLLGWARSVSKDCCNHNNWFYLHPANLMTYFHSSYINVFFPLL